MKSNAAPAFTKAAVSVDEFCQSVSIGRSKFYDEVKAGRIKVLKSGRRTIIPASEVQAWLDRLSGLAA